MEVRRRYEPLRRPNAGPVSFTTGKRIVKKLEQNDESNKPLAPDLVPKGGTHFVGSWLEMHQDWDRLDSPAESWPSVAADAVDSRGPIVSVQTISFGDGKCHDNTCRALGRLRTGLHDCALACTIGAAVDHHRRAQRHGRQFCRPERPGVPRRRRNGDRGTGRHGAGQARSRRSAAITRTSRISPPGSPGDGTTPKASS